MDPLYVPAAVAALNLTNKVVLLTAPEPLFVNVIEEV